METNKKPGKEFHAVEFMRQVREEMTEQFIEDRQKYLEYLKKSIADFKIRQAKAFNKEGL
ncbi:hypothetical protein G3O08_09240 [Cryomorpha ignava]|uniref:Uncharacterized protein n=1 Tax=Cryomorpha ignava TaxID=101383 RepID=A0A7K3WQB6_9FLAO|nr:hypothetical protein [Cryomorpha ignava]NEN23684.1 hypothetical protein [Cryomorpha ignava]